MIHSARICVLKGIHVWGGVQLQLTRTHLQIEGTFGQGKAEVTAQSWKWNATTCWPPVSYKRRHFFCESNENSSHLEASDTNQGECMNIWMDVLSTPCTTRALNYMINSIHHGCVCFCAGNVIRPGATRTPFLSRCVSVCVCCHDFHDSIIIGRPLPKLLISLVFQMQPRSAGHDTFENSG